MYNQPNLPIKPQTVFQFQSNLRSDPLSCKCTHTSAWTPHLATLLSRHLQRNVEIRVYHLCSLQWSSMDTAQQSSDRADQVVLGACMVVRLRLSWCTPKWRLSNIAEHREVGGWSWMSRWWAETCHWEVVAWSWTKLCELMWHWRHWWKTIEMQQKYWN